MPIMTMINFICPVCKKELVCSEKSLKCPDGHCFDISRKGTVNLLLSNKSGHGDDKRMVTARKMFLDKGYYEHLHKAVREAAAEYAHDGCVLLDCGCGECSYTADISAHLRSLGISADIIGIDVSKEAINAGASRHAGIRLAVASVFDIPLSDKSCDILIALFSPFSGGEYLRVLRDGGIYITAYPLEDHLFELKKAIYERPYRNEVSGTAVKGFELLSYSECRRKIRLTSNEDVIALFEMTPYCYKTSREDRAKLDKIQTLEVSADFGIAVYQKSAILS